MKIATAIFKYRDTSGTIYSHEFEIVFIKGMDLPFRWEYVPKKIFTSINANSKTFYRGFKRIFDIKLQTLNTYEDFICAFLQSNFKSVSYYGKSIYLDEGICIDENDSFENEYLEGVEFSKTYYLALRETSVRTVWPNLFEIVTDDIMYFKNDIEITGTYEAPQTLTTNVGALALRENGDAFPAISLLSYKVTVLALSSNWTEATFGVKNIVQNGANISFDIFVSAGGRPNPSDGKFYANISIGLEAITV